MTEAFWSIPIAEQDRHKTAFISQFGLWEWNSMPFSLTNAPATQQRFMDMILMGLQWEVCVTYIDDIVIFSQTFSDHLTRLEKILDQLRTHKLRINVKKVQLCQGKFKLLGYTISEEGIHPNKDKTEAIANYPIPANAKELMTFLGMVSWC
jgi:hypothetical protein